MDTNELLSSIANLEESLKEIDSAKEQVNHTIKAYRNVSEQIENYSASLEEVSEHILAMLKAVKSNHETLNSDFDEKLKEWLVVIDKELSKFRSATDALSEKFTKQCEVSTSEVQKTLMKTKDSFTADCSTLQTSFKRKTIETLTSFGTKIDVEVEKVELCMQQLDETFSSFAKLHSEIDEKLIEHNQSVKKEIRDVRNHSETLFQTTDTNSLSNFAKLNSAMELNIAEHTELIKQKLKTSRYITIGLGVVIVALNVYILFAK